MNHLSSQHPFNAAPSFHSNAGNHQGSLSFSGSATLAAATIIIFPKPPHLSICAFAVAAIVSMTGCNPKAQSDSQIQEKAKVAQERGIADDRARVEEAHRDDLERSQRLTERIRLDDEKRRQDAEAFQNAEKTRISGEEQARRLATQNAEKERTAQEQEAKERADTATRHEQEERTKVAEARFGKISLYPKIILSGFLQKGGASAELRGDNLGKLREQLTAKNWVGFLKAIGAMKSDSDYLPETRSMESIADQFERTRKFPLLIRAPLVKGSDFLSKNTEFSYSLIVSPHGGNDLQIYATRITTPHPDGIGYIVNWSPEYGDVLIVAGIGVQVDQKIRELDGALAKLRNSIGVKMRLGELTQEDAAAQLAKGQEQVRLELYAWAGVAQSNDPVGRIAEAFQKYDFAGFTRLVDEAAQQHPADVYFSTLKSQAHEMLSIIEEAKTAKADQAKVATHARELKKQADEYRGEGSKDSEWRSEATRIEIEADKAVSAAGVRVKTAVSTIRQLISQRTVVQ